MSFDNPNHDPADYAFYNNPKTAATTNSHSSRNYAEHIRHASYFEKEREIFYKDALKDLEAKYDARAAKEAELVALKAKLEEGEE